jgi:hypothetical protein
LNAIVLAGLRKNFTYVLPFPGDTVMYFASARNTLASSPGYLAAAAAERLPGAGRLSELFFEDMLSSARLEWFYKNVSLRESRLSNRDFFPRLVYTQWQYEKRKSEINPWRKAPPFIPLFAGRDWRGVGNAVFPGIVIAAVGAIAAVFALQPSRRKVLVLATATSGWWGMTVSMQLLLAYQSVAGALYQTGALLIGAFMAAYDRGGIFHWRRIARVAGYGCRLRGIILVLLSGAIFLFFLAKIISLYNIPTLVFCSLSPACSRFRITSRWLVYLASKEGPKPWACMFDLMGDLPPGRCRSVLFPL